MTPETLLGIVPFKRFNDLLQIRHFINCFAVSTMKKFVPYFTLLVLFSTSSVRFIFKDITNREVIKIIMSSEKLNSKENVRFLSE